MENKLSYIDKIKTAKARTKVISTLRSEELRDYLAQKTDEEKNEIIKNLPNKLLELSPEYLKVWRQYGDAQVISENIDIFMQKEQNLNKDDIQARTEILSRMYQKNHRIYNTINFDLLDERYIKRFGEDKINQFASFPKQQEMLLTLGSREDFSLDILAKCIEEHNDDNTWTRTS